MREHRALTFAGAGSVLAATIAIVATLSVNTPRSTVGAATIFASLQEAVNNAVRISFDRIRDDEGTVDAEVVILSAGDDEEAVGPMAGAKAVYFEARIKVDADAPMLAGLDYETSGAFSAEGMWLYVKTHKLPSDTAEQNPLIANALVSYQNGMLFEMGDFIKNLGDYDWSSYAEALGGGQPAIGSGDDALSNAEGWDQLEQIIGEDKTREVQKAVEKAVASSSQRGSTRILNSPGLPVIITSGDHEIIGLLSNVLTGQADAEDLERLIALIEESAVSATVTRQPDGTHLLRASDFTFDGAGLDPTDEALLEDVAIEISYDEQAGLLWAVMTHVGDQDGTVRLERVEVQPDDPMFSSQRYREDGLTQIMDMSSIMGLVQGLEKIGE